MKRLLTMLLSAALLIQLSQAAEERDKIFRHKRGNRWQLVQQPGQHGGNRLE